MPIRAAIGLLSGIELPIREVIGLLLGIELTIREAIGLLSGIELPIREVIGLLSGIEIAWELETDSRLLHLFDMPDRTESATEFKRSFSDAIRHKMKEDHISVSALALRMGAAPTVVRRILDAKNTSITFRSVSRAAQAVGLKIQLVTDPLSAQELGKLAERLAGNPDPAESARLEAQITKGFYAGS